MKTKKDILDLIKENNRVIEEGFALLFADEKKQPSTSFPFFDFNAAKKPDHLKFEYTDKEFGDDFFRFMGKYDRKPDVSKAVALLNVSMSWLFRCGLDVEDAVASLRGAWPAMPKITVKEGSAVQ